MDLLIDGHNLAFKLFFDSLEDSQSLHTRVIKHLVQYTRITGHRCFIVFDSYKGTSEIFGHRKRKPRVSWLFVTDADEELRRRMSELEKPERWLIISNDKEITTFAVSLGIEVMLSSKFAKATTFWINGDIVQHKAVRNIPYRRFGKPVPIIQMITLRNKIKYALLDMWATLRKS